MAKKRIWLYTLNLLFTDTPMSQFILIKAEHIGINLVLFVSLSFFGMKINTLVG